MAQENLVSFAVTDAEMAEIMGAVTVLQEKLMPKLLTLTPETRRELPKMGNKTTTFVQKAMEYCGNNPALVPPYLDVDACRIDLKAVESIRALHQPLAQIVESLDDTMLLSGSEAYSGALMFYQSVKTASKSGIHGAVTVYSELAERFPPKNLRRGGEPKTVTAE